MQILENTLGQDQCLKKKKKRSIPRGSAYAAPLLLVEIGGTDYSSKSAMPSERPPGATLAQVGGHHAVLAPALSLTRGPAAHLALV